MTYDSEYNSNSFKKTNGPSLSVTLHSGPPYVALITGFSGMLMGVVFVLIKHNN